MLSLYITPIECNRTRDSKQVLEGGYSFSPFYSIVSKTSEAPFGNPNRVLTSVRGPFGNPNRVLTSARRPFGNPNRVITSARGPFGNPNGVLTSARMPFGNPNRVFYLTFHIFY